MITFDSVNRDKIITELYGHPELIKVAKRMTNDGVLDYRDLLTSAIMKLMELPDEAFFKIGNYRGYVYGIMRHQNANPYEQFNKHNQFSGSQLVESITEQFVEDATEEPEFTYDEFAKFCHVSAESDHSEDVKLAAKVTYGYLVYQPTNNEKKSYRSFQFETGIHYSSICQYVKKMRELYINEKNQISNDQ